MISTCRSADLGREPRSPGLVTSRLSKRDRLLNVMCNGGAWTTGQNLCAEVLAQRGRFLRLTCGWRWPERWGCKEPRAVRKLIARQTDALPRMDALADEVA